ncbi:unnamed protein product, partial [Allacma fusca]
VVLILAEPLESIRDFKESEKRKNTLDGQAGDHQSLAEV